MATLKTVAGGGLGLGGTALARRQLDDPSRDRFTQPSVLYGLGTGLLASGLFMADNIGVINNVPLGPDFWASHAITATPSGAFSAAFPKSATQSAAQQVKQSLSSRFGGDLPLTGGNGGPGTGGSGGSGGTESITLQRQGRGGEYGENGKHWRG